MKTSDKFLVYVLITILVFFNIRTEVLMYNLGDRLDQAIKNGALDPGLISELNSISYSLNALSGWLPNGGDRPLFTGRPESLGKVSDHGLVRLISSAGQTISNDTITKLLFTTTDLPDYAGLGAPWDVTPLDHVTIVEDGIYLVSAFATFATAMTGTRFLRIDTDPTGLFNSDVSSTDPMPYLTLNITNIFYFTAGQEIVARVYQNSGVDTSITHKSLVVVRLRGIKGN